MVVGSRGKLVSVVVNSDVGAAEAETSVVGAGDIPVWYKAETGASSCFDAAVDRPPQTPSTDKHTNNNTPRVRPLAMVPLMSITRGEQPSPGQCVAQAITEARHRIR